LTALLINDLINLRELSLCISVFKTLVVDEKKLILVISLVVEQKGAFYEDMTDHHSCTGIIL